MPGRTVEKESVVCVLKQASQGRCIFRPQRQECDRQTGSDLEFVPNGSGYEPETIDTAPARFLSSDIKIPKIVPV